VALDVPIVLMRHHGAVRAAELFQLATIDALAVFVGRRIDRESAARAEAERVRTVLRASEAKYRGLFDTSPTPVLLLGADGEVREINPAAVEFLRVRPSPAARPALADLVGALPARAILDAIRWGGRRTEDLALSRADGETAWVRPLVSQVPDDGQGALYQVLLHDMTEERRRQEELRSYARAVLRAQEDERKRLSQEIHDETIQDLVLLSRQLDALANLPRKVLSQELAAGLASARAFAAEIMQGLRDLARALRPPVLEQLGLAASLRQLLTDVERRTGLACRLQVQGGLGRLAPEIELGLFRIAQEALHNAERHARATHVSVRLVLAEDEVRLSVSDNGVGFRPAGAGRAEPGHRLGLAGMRERAEALGGRVEIRSAPGKGTRVRARVPAVYPPAPAASAPTLPRPSAETEPEPPRAGRQAESP
jgi:signal transduction histidine kinase